MAGITKTNQDGRDHDVQYNPGKVICVEIDAGVSLAAKDGVDGALAQIVQEFSPLLYKSTGTAGKIFAIMDGHAADNEVGNGNSMPALKARLNNMGTVDGVDLSAQDVLLRDIDDFSAA